MSLTVAEFPDGVEDLMGHLRAGDMPIYVPLELAGQRRHILGRIWPTMRSYNVSEDNSVSDELFRSGGWRYVEASPEAPHLNTTELGLRKALAELGRDGMNWTEYVISSQMSRVLTGGYMDENTWCRLLGMLCSSGNVGVVHGSLFGADGYVYVYPHWDPQDRDGKLGGRSSEEV